MHVLPDSSGSLSWLSWGLKCQQFEKCKIKMERVFDTKLETRQITFKYWPKVADSLKLMLSCLCQNIFIVSIYIISFLIH